MYSPDRSFALLSPSLIFTGGRQSSGHDAAVRVSGRQSYRRPRAGRSRDGAPDWAMDAARRRSPHVDRAAICMRVCMWGSDRDTSESPRRFRATRSRASHGGGPGLSESGCNSLNLTIPSVVAVGPGNAMMPGLGGRCDVPAAWQGLFKLLAVTGSPRRCRIMTRMVPPSH